MGLNRISGGKDSGGRLSLLDRLFFRLDVMTYSEFISYDEMMGSLFESLRKNVEAQLAFNRLVSERLGLSGVNDDGGSDSGLGDDVAFG